MEIIKQLVEIYMYMVNFRDRTVEVNDGEHTDDVLKKSKSEIP